MGLNSKGIDLNLSFIKHVKNTGLDARRFLSELTNFPAKHAGSPLVASIVTDWATLLLAQQPRLIAISYFSYYGQPIGEALCKEIKKISPDTKIVIGGSGITLAINDTPAYASRLKSEGTIDFYISGSSEQLWPKFLAEFFGVGIPIVFNSDKIDIPYLADYSDYDMGEYEHYRNVHGLLLVYITGSVGCIRDCAFCEIPGKWKFTQRSHTNILREIANVIPLADNLFIKFNDSLVNGSLSEFNRILDGLILLQQEVDHTFWWGGQFICRPGKVDNWEKIAKSGCRHVEIGIETGSDSLRYEMDKKFLNADLIYAVSEMKKYGVRAVFLMFCGYPTETLAQFEETLDLFRTLQPYAGTTISAVQLNYSFCVFPGTPLYEKRESINLKVTDDPAQWFCENNPTLTFAERVRRRIITQEVLEDLGYILADSIPFALVELVANYIRYRKGREYTFDEMVFEVLGRPTTIKHRFFDN